MRQKEPGLGVWEVIGDRLTLGDCEIREVDPGKGAEVFSSETLDYARGLMRRKADSVVLFGTLRVGISDSRDFQKNETPPEIEFAEMVISDREEIEENLPGIVVSQACSEECVRHLPHLEREFQKYLNESHVEDVLGFWENLLEMEKDAIIESPMEGLGHLLTLRLENHRYLMAFCREYEG